MHKIVVRLNMQNEGVAALGESTDLGSAALYNDSGACHHNRLRQNLHSKI